MATHWTPAVASLLIPLCSFTHTLSICFRSLPLTLTLPNRCSLSNERWVHVDVADGPRLSRRRNVENGAVRIKHAKVRSPESGQWTVSVLPCAVIAAQKVFCVVLHCDLSHNAKQRKGLSEQQ